MKLFYLPFLPFIGSRKTLAGLVHLERVNKNPKMLQFTIARATRESHEPNVPNAIFVM